MFLFFLCIHNYVIYYCKPFVCDKNILSGKKIFCPFAKKLYFCTLNSWAIACVLMTQ